MTIADERLRFELKAAKDGLGRIAATERFTWEGRAACVALSVIQRLEALARDALNELNEGEQMLNIKLKQLSPDAILPAYAKDGDAGMDLRALIPKPIWLQADECKLIPTGIAIYIEDKNYAAFILPRSGLGHKHGLVLGNLVGTIDAPYQGELMVSAWNRSGVAYEIKPQERIAQLVFQRVERVQFEIVDDFVASERGAGGFGSSGSI